jgi:hypothetical protein
MPGKLSGPPWFRRVAIRTALALAIIEIALFVVAWRFGVLVEPRGSRAMRDFVVLGTMITLQAMGVVSIAWGLVALSQTELEWDDHVRLEHPWRSWVGDWHDLRRVWWRNGWLAIEVDGEWRRWYVRVPDVSVDGVTALRSVLPPGVWLEGAALRAYLFSLVLPRLLAGIGIAGLLFVALTAYLRSF